jgi:hypothetical protein
VVTQGKPGFSFIKKTQSQPQNAQNVVQSNDGGNKNQGKPGFSFIKKVGENQNTSVNVNSNQNKKGDINFEEIFSTSNSSSQNYSSNNNNNNIINSLNTLDLTKGK